MSTSSIKYGQLYYRMKEDEDGDDEYDRLVEITMAEEAKEIASEGE